MGWYEAVTARRRQLTLAVLAGIVLLGLAAMIAATPAPAVEPALPGESGHAGSASRATPRSLNIQCGPIHSRRLRKATFGKRYSVFTYKYYRCGFARRLVRAYIRRTPRMVRCYRNQWLCGARISGWKCQLGYLHGTVVRCVPRNASWEGTKRPFIGVTRSW